MRLEPGILLRGLLRKPTKHGKVTQGRQLSISNHPHGIILYNREIIFQTLIILCNCIWENFVIWAILKLITNLLKYDNQHTDWYKCFYILLSVSSGSVFFYFPAHVSRYIYIYIHTTSSHGAKL